MTIKTFIAAFKAGLNSNTTCDNPTCKDFNKLPPQTYSEYKKRLQEEERK